jgi:hypothetical protein
MSVHKKTNKTYYTYMINSIIELLKYSKSKSEIVQIAKGKYKLPNSIKEAYNQFKTEIKWQSKKR